MYRQLGATDDAPLQLFYLQGVLLWAFIFMNDQYPIKSVMEEY